MDNFFLQSWEALLRSFVLLAGSYAALILILRTSGKRTLSKMNAFDLVITVSLGSTLATLALSKDVALVQGVFVLALLASLQFIVAWLSVRSKTVRSVVKSTPRMLFENGRFLQNALTSERVTQEEIHAAIRGRGISDVSKIAAVVLETDGSFSVVQVEPGADRSALEHVRREAA